jgi:hypothetical protein
MVAAVTHLFEGLGFGDVKGKVVPVLNELSTTP